MPCKSAITSMSLGRAWVHDMELKLREASKAGFEGIEIFYEDLEYLAKSYGGTDESHLLRAAERIGAICDELNLTVIGLQPFLFYEGLLSRDEHRSRIVKLKTWFKIVKLLKTDLIQIPSNFQSTGVSGDMDLIAEDMIEVADMGAQQDPPVRFVYENIAWGTYIDTWQGVWNVVSKVNRPNFGTCLDTFQITGRVWADPTSPSGKTPNADHDLQQSLEELVRTVDVSKVFYIQVVDAEKMREPLVEGHAFHVDGQPPRMSWSRNCRLFLYEEDRGGYMPVAEVARVLIKELGFDGWVSMELFSRSMSDPDAGVPQAHAQRGIQSWQRLKRELCL